MFTVEPRIFDATHQFHPMFGEMEIQAGVAGLIALATAQIGFAFVAALRDQPVGVIAAGQLVARHYLQPPRQKVARRLLLRARSHQRPFPARHALREGELGQWLRRQTPINNWTDAVGNGAVVALDPNTGEHKWTFKQYDVTDNGILTTATDLLFTGGREGYFYALDAVTGTELWKASLGGQIVNGPITYAIDGTQYVAIISGHSLVTFKLRQ